MKTSTLEGKRLNKRGAGRPKLPDFKKRKAKSVTLSPEAIYAIEQEAKKRDIPFSEVIERAVRKVLGI
jgi:hypothetical protein